MDSFSHKYGESTFHFVFITKCRYNKAFQLLKGASSYALFRVIPNFRKRCPRGFWGRNGTFRSVGDVDTNTVVDYVERQNQLPLNHFI